MRKIWVLFVMLLLSACGMGGDESSTGAGNVREVEQNSPMGKVDINIQEDIAKTVAAAPAATHMRLVITNPNLKINGITLKYILDGIMPDGNKVSGLKFPLANGYAFELLTYTPSSVGATTVTVNRMLKYAKISNVTIGATDTSVNLNLEAIKASFTFPTEKVYSGSLLGTITATLQKSTPLQSPWKLYVKTDPTQANSALHYTTGFLTSYTSIKAPYVLTPGYLYGQGEFFINSALLDLTGTLTIVDPTTLQNVTHSAEKNTSWTFNYPNPDFGDSIDLVKVPLDVLGMDINITTGAQ